MMDRVWNKLEQVATLIAAISLLSFLAIALLALIRSDSKQTDASQAQLSQLSRLHLAAIELSHASRTRNQHLSIVLGREVMNDATELVAQMSTLADASPQIARVSSWLPEYETAWRAVARQAEATTDQFDELTVRADQLVFQLRMRMSDIGADLQSKLSAERDRTRTLITGLTACVVSGIAAAGMVIWRLQQSLRRASRAERELRAQADMLEVAVATRTSELAATEGQLRQAIGSAPDAFLAFDTAGRLFAANDLAHELFSGDVVNLQGAARSDLMAILRIDLCLGEQEIELDSGRHYKVTTRAADDGTTVMRIADLTTEKRALRTMQAALAREQRLRTLANDFVAMVSHQFRTPLALIDSGAQKIFRRGTQMDADELRERAHYIRHAAAGLSYLVDGALDAARIEGGEMAMNPTEVDLPLLIEDLCKQMRELHRDRQFVLHLEHLPTVICDPLLLDQAMTNLLTNAVKYSPDGTAIHVAGTATSQWLAVSVTDYGVGIPQGEIERVFEPAYRASNAAAFEGVGLGLHVSRHIARLHGGDVVATSGDGSTVFTLRLPVRTAEQSAA